jgi:DNA protecting protein DprA
MTCPDCQRRAALVAALAPEISRLSFTREGLLELLGLPNEQLLHATRIRDPDEFLRRIEVGTPPLTKKVTTSLCRHDLDYPEALAKLYCAPAVLHATCGVERLRELLTRPTVAIVGGREHTRYAHDMTVALARDLATAGVTVISGIDQGLEGTAHHRAIQAGGHTIAVMPGTPHIPYSKQHENLHRYILSQGAAISEFPPGFFPIQHWCFIACRRILAALAQVVVVIEAMGKVSALLVTQIAAEVGADIAVVPGRVTDPGAFRIFRLLCDGAHPVACAQDVLDVIHGTGARGVAIESDKRYDRAPNVRAVSCAG